MSSKIRPSTHLPKTQRAKQASLERSITIPTQNIMNPKYQANKKTLDNSITENGKIQPKKRAITEGNMNSLENPEFQSYTEQIKQKKTAIYIPVKNLQLPNKKQNKIKTQPNQKIPNQTNTECVLSKTQKQTLDKMISMSIKFHDPQMCVCRYCSCGNHLCKVHVWKKPGIKTSSTYQKDFFKKDPIRNQSFRPLSSYAGCAPVMDPLSIYTKEYSSKQGHTDPKFYPVNCLTTGGPFNPITTYSSGFPGYRVNPTQSLKPGGGQVIQGFPINGTSYYKKQFTPKAVKESEPFKPTSNLKTGDKWMGTSTYRDNFVKPNFSYSSGWRSNIARVQDAKYSNQFNTTYRNAYVNQGNQVCPAVEQLKTRSRFFSGAKRSKVEGSKRNIEGLSNSVV